MNTLTDKFEQCISIVLSTYNRSDALRNCLCWLNDCEVPSEASVELVVVDNNSVDDTRAVVEQFGRVAKFNVVYVFESRQGVSFARNSGIAAASGDLLVFIDDDCLAAGDWLIEVKKTFDQDELLAGAGGRVELYDERDLPLTIRTSSERARAAPSNLFSLVLGCNMCFRRSAIESVGLFDERFGVGTKLQSAEDSDYIYRGIKAGLKIDYVPEILVFHAHGRRTQDAVGKLAKGYVVGRGAFYAKNILSGDRTMIMRAYWEFRYRTIGIFSNKGGRASLRHFGYLLKGIFLYIGSALSRSSSNRSGTQR